MKRIALVIVIAVLAAIGAALIVTGDGSSYRVAATFDTAHGIIAGNQVKVAGVAVGRVDEVELAPGPKARVVMSLDSERGPFRRDATCTILPEGLISENFVQCDPGSSREPLARAAQGVPTVPLARTTVPASLQQVLDVFSAPVPDRLRVIVNELGIATAGRGEDLNALLKRSNPALVEAQRVLKIVNAQREELATGIRQTNRVLAELADEKRSVRSFVDNAAIVARSSAAHKAALGQSIRRLPGLLDAVRPGLRSLDRAVDRGTPLLDSLRSAAPALTTSTRAFSSFVDAAIPALKSLSPTARIAQRAVRAARPVVAHLKRASAEATPFARDLNGLLVSTRDSGGIEGLMTLFYALATFTSAYDEISHLASGIIQLSPQCIPNTGAPGCSYKYSAPGNGTIPTDDPACGPQSGAMWDPPTNCRSSGVPIRSHAKRNVRQSGSERPATKRPRRAAPAKTPAAGEAKPPAAGEAKAPAPANPPANPIQRLLDFLLKP